MYIGGKSIKIFACRLQDRYHSDLESILHKPTTYRSLMNNKSLPICNQLQNGVSLEPKKTKTCIAVGVQFQYH